MTDQTDILMLFVFGPSLGATAIWIFWMIPWIVMNGYRPAGIMAFLLGFKFIFDLMIAIEIAAKNRKWPFPLKLHLTFIGVTVVSMILLFTEYK